MATAYAGSKVSQCNIRCEGLEKVSVACDRAYRLTGVETLKIVLERPLIEHGENVETVRILTQAAERTQ